MAWTTGAEIHVREAIAGTWCPDRWRDRAPTGRPSLAAAGRLGTGDAGRATGDPLPEGTSVVAFPAAWREPTIGGMPQAEHARQPASRSSAPSGAGRPRSSAPLDSLSASVLALQAQAGNGAVSALLQRGARSSPAAPAPPPTAPPPTAPPPTTAAAPPKEGRAIERLGIVDNDTVGGGGLNLRAEPDGAVLARLAHNDHVMVRMDVGGDWVYVVATDGAAKGTAGYASNLHINTNLPPSAANPDPGAVLYRIQGGERAHDVVRRHYGADAMVAGQDQRFFTNVLKYVNEDAGRGRFLVTKTKIRSGGGGLFGSIGVPYEDIELVAGSKIWIPSLPYAQALKGTVSAGSFARDAWEKVKDVGSKLVAVPAFIAGLVVGALESVRDLIVGLFELVWGVIKTAGGMLVDAASAIWGLITDPTKRQVLLDSIDAELQEMLYKGSLMRRAYNWGRIVGYATMEVVTFVLFAGATAALKAGKFGARLAKVFQVIKETEAVQKALKAAAALRKTKTAAKIIATVEKTAAKVEPVTKAIKKVAGAAGKVTGAPGEAVLGASRLLTRQMRKVARRYGWSESRLAEVLGIVEKRGATAYLRRSSKWAPARLSEGALPKPLPIKANTLDELDLILSHGQFTRKELGLVAHFEPLPSWARPPEISPRRWKAMQPELEARYQKRLASFQKNESDMRKLAVPNSSRDSTYFEIKGGDKVKGGLVYQVDIDDAGKVARHALTGDVDVFEFRTKGGRSTGPEYEMLDELFLEAGVSEHGGHMAWRRRGDYNEDAFFGILEGHLKDPVIEIGPGGKVRELTADRVPGVADVLSSPEYKAWKAKKAGGTGR